MQDDSALYVVANYRLVDDAWAWLQVYYDHSALEKIAHLTEGDMFSEDSYIMGREHLEEGNWRIGCASAETVARLLEGREDSES